MKLSELCKAGNLTVPEEFADTEIQSVVTDSAKATEHSLFICIAGLHTDGHRYIKDAIANGCACILMQADRAVPVPDGICGLSCDNTRKASALIFHAFYGYPCKRLHIIGVTGTNGKTSVACLLRKIFETALYSVGIIGTLGCYSKGKKLALDSDGTLANMTTPDPEDLYRILRRMALDGVDYVIMETSSHALALDKLAPITFETAIFTNLTPEHLDFHRTMEAYAKAKQKLFAKSRRSILNPDLPYADRMAEASACPITVGTSASCQYRGEQISLLGWDGVSYELVSKKARIGIRCPIPGKFTVANSMLAAVCALEMGIRPPVLQAGLLDCSGIPGRMEQIKLGVRADFRVLIDYAHTPDALENLLRSVRAFCKPNERIVLLFGCGGDRDRTKRPLMGAIAQQYADEVTVTSDNSRSESPQQIIREIRSGMNLHLESVIPNRRQAIQQLIRQAKAGDVILLAGKGHETYEITKDGRLPFSERQIVLEAYEKRIR